ncbi:MAG: hypothetical protein M3Y56_11510 [Armatimonadota bacterium]|nr:hypothetical protein [Armatimonadota bacterium]
MRKKEEPSKFSRVFAGKADGSTAVDGSTQAGDAEEKPLSKFQDPAFGMFTFHLRRTVHAKFKGLCAEDVVEMSVEVEEMIVERLRQRGKI